ncbi:hypothetical protein GCM10027569_72360 [Flindersiella endophytica]
MASRKLSPGGTELSNLHYLAAEKGLSDEALGKCDRLASHILHELRISGQPSTGQLITVLKRVLVGTVETNRARAMEQFEAEQATLMRNFSHAASFVKVAAAGELLTISDPACLQQLRSWHKITEDAWQEQLEKDDAHDGTKRRLESNAALWFRSISYNVGKRNQDALLEALLSGISSYVAKPAVKSRLTKYLLDPSVTDEQVEAVESHRDVLAGLTPRNLPPNVPDFVGRRVELQGLDGILASPSPAPRIAAITGPPGVGKTGLALYWAHQMRDQFPDGDLYIDLRGYSAGEPVAPAEAFARLLRQLGVGDADIPADEEDRAALYRTQLHGRRMLVLLDNAHDSQHVRNLIPGSVACTVLVTSRDDLSGLVAARGAHHRRLWLLDMEHAIDLLRSAIDDERVDADPEALRKLAARCARLPLALRVTAATAKVRRNVPLNALAADLEDEQQRLQVMSPAKNPEMAVRSVFSWSYKYLEPRVALTFRLTGFHPGPNIDKYATAALVGSDEAVARRQMEALVGVSLFEEMRAHRYTTHDLLSAYAREQARDEDDSAEVQQALTRLVDYYKYVALECVNLVAPQYMKRRPTLPTFGGALPVIDSPELAHNWLKDESENLTAIIELAKRDGFAEAVIDLSATLYGYYDNTALYWQGYELHSDAAALAHAREEVAGEAGALMRLGLHAFDLESTPRQKPHFHRPPNCLLVFKTMREQYGLMEISDCFMEQQASSIKQPSVPSRCLCGRGSAATAQRNYGLSSTSGTLTPSGECIAKPFAGSRSLWPSVATWGIVEGKAGLSAM